MSLEKLDNRRHDLSVNLSDGKIILSAKLADMLSLNSGDAINIRIDGPEKLLYRVEPVTYRGSKGICKSVCRGRTLRTFWKECASILLNDIKAQQARFLTGEPQTIDGTTYIPIITKFSL